MFQPKDRRPLRPQISVGSAVVLYHTVGLLLLARCSEGQFQVIGPPQPIVTVAGDDILLPCHLEPAVDAVSMAVEWTRPDLSPRFVHTRRGGQDLLDHQNPTYEGRTSVFNNKLKLGDVSLKLSRVKFSDAGTYRCFIPGLNRDAVVQLIVGAVSSPVIVGIDRVSSTVMLDCETKGWYPEPEVLWLDAEGNLLSAGPTETVRGPDDLYTVSSRLTVEKRHSNNFTCRVQQKDINQTRETQIHLPDDLFMAQSHPAVRITICLAVCFMSIVAAVFIVWKWGRNQIKTTNHSNEHQYLMDGVGDEGHMTGSKKMVHWDKTKAKLDEELQKIEGGLQHVQQVITTLTDQKKDLKIQRQKLISLQQENKTQIKENEKKLKGTPKSGKDKKRKKRQAAGQDLKKRETEHDELLQNTEKLLETTDDLIIKTTERKAKLERDKEQIEKNLKETERQRPETQRKLQLEQKEKEDEMNVKRCEPSEKFVCSDPPGHVTKEPSNNSLLESP